MSILNGPARRRWEVCNLSIKKHSQHKVQKPPFQVHVDPQLSKDDNSKEQRLLQQSFTEQLQRIATAQVDVVEGSQELTVEGQWVAESILDPRADLVRIQLRRYSAQDNLWQEGECLQSIYPTAIAWLPNQTGFFYDRYLPFSGGHGLYFHIVGTAQSADSCLYYDPTQPEWYYQPFVSPDGRWLLVSILHNGATNRLTLFPLPIDKPNAGSVIELIDTFHGRYDPIDWTSDQLVMRATMSTSLNGCLLAIDLTAPYSISTLLPPTQSLVLIDAVPTANGWVVSYLNGGASQLHHVDQQSILIEQIPLPGLGTVTELASDRQHKTITFTYSDYSHPSRQYRYTLEDGRFVDILSTPGSGFTRCTDRDDDAPFIVTQRLWISSSDGTQLPLFLAHHQQVTPSNCPTILNSYGGLGLSLTPRFVAEGLAWMMQGGVWATICARGGGELGAAWHQAAVGIHKQKSFDDVLAAAEWLCVEGVTSPARLGLWGASNGGLTAGACLTQKPAQFGAVVIESGLLDMLNYHRLGCGRNWVTEYGSPERPTDRHILAAYSPLHNIQPGTAYPATLITTHEQDRRVGETHSFRFAAALQEANAGSAPILLHLSAGAGHVHSDEKESRLGQMADVLTFFATHLGMSAL